jgi:N-acyl-D-amino-acid deacylase
MKKWLVILALVTLVLSFRTITKNHNDPAAISTAIAKSIAILQPSDRLFLENAGSCHSCHHQDLTAISVYMAKQKGYPVNDTIYNENIASILATLRARKSTNAQHNDPAAIVMSGSYSLWALSENKYPANKSMQLMVKNLMQRQTASGAWVSPNPRPPLEYYAFTATALAIKAMIDYAPVSMNNEVKQRREKARQWMMQEIPEANEEKAFQLLGLYWADADKNSIRVQAKKLLLAQRADGGWPQLDSLPTDAYATGQSLYALYTSGQLETSDPAFQKGISFLLSNQKPDGSWRIRSRSFASLPFVETGFPESGDQFISAAGSNWATIALLLASPKIK